MKHRNWRFGACGRSGTDLGLYCFSRRISLWILTVSSLRHGAKITWKALNSENWHFSSKGNYQA